MLDISQATIRQNSSSSSFSRGKDYFRDGAVISLSRRGATLVAEVEGSDVEPYNVAVTFGPDDDAEAECDCPYEGEGWCKHIVAALLTWINEPEEVEEHPALETLLAPMDRDALQALILNLARRIPGLADELELEVAVLHPPPAGQPTLRDADSPSAPPPLVAPELSLVRKKIRATIKEVAAGGSYDQWDDDGYFQLEELKAGVEEFSRTKFPCPA